MNFMVLLICNAFLYLGIYLSIGVWFIIENHNLEQRVLSQSDLYTILPFGKTKIQQLIKSGQLPLMKIGKDYITTFNLLEKWIGEHLGEEIYY